MFFTYLSSLIIKTAKEGQITGGVTIYSPFLPVVPAVLQLGGSVGSGTVWGSHAESQTKKDLLGSTK